MTARRILALALIAATFLFSLDASAKKKGKEKVKEEKVKTEKIETLTLHIFAVSMSFSDSIMYMSNIQTIENATIRDKYFFDQRAEYSAQFKKWLEDGGSSLQVSSLYFYKNHKKALKGYRTVRKKAMKKHEATIQTVPEFLFDTVN